MINGNRSTVQITHYDGPVPVRGPAKVYTCDDAGSLEDNLARKMLLYRTCHSKPTEQNSKVNVIAYFSVDGKTLHKVSTAIDAKDYFGYDDNVDFADVIIAPTLEGICKKILETTGDKELAEYIICLDQSL